MKEQQIEKDLQSIRQLMERSSKFISLSGLSGVMSGTYALIGFARAYRLIYGDYRIFHYHDYFLVPYQTLLKLITIALVVLIASIVTGIWLSFLKAKKKGHLFFVPATKYLLVNLAIPLVTGGVFILILLSRGYYGITAPACLIFYGLALVAASHYTYGDVRWLGFFEIVIGLFSAWFPWYGLLCWAFGFGILHILYGIIMYYKYER
jgi:hypothetical protein